MHIFLIVSHCQKSLKAANWRESGVKMGNQLGEWLCQDSKYTEKSTDPIHILETDIRKICQLFAI